MKPRLTPLTRETADKMLMRQIAGELLSAHTPARSPAPAVYHATQDELDALTPSRVRQYGSAEASRLN